jgi:hypothetical protein
MGMILSQFSVIKHEDSKSTVLMFVDRSSAFAGLKESKHMKKQVIGIAVLLTVSQLVTGATLMKENDVWKNDANDTWLASRVQELDKKLKDPRSPVWVQDVSEIMPGWGFEIHCKRWIDGLDAILYSLRDGCCYRTPFGRYGDNTAAGLNQMENMANAVQSYLDLTSPAGQLEKEIHAILGDPTEEKKQACQCFVEVVRTYVEEQGPSDSFTAAGEKWRRQTDGNPILKLIFSGEGLDRGLCDGGGFWAGKRLLTVLRIIGGTQTDTEDLLYSCNYQLRHVFRDDRERMAITKGYPVGIAAYLNGDSIETVRTSFPGTSGYAIKAYTCSQKRAEA